jgi:hypothetical protein
MSKAKIIFTFGSAERVYFIRVLLINKPLTVFAETSVSVLEFIYCSLFYYLIIF